MKRSYNYPESAFITWALIKSKYQAYQQLFEKYMETQSMVQLTEDEQGRLYNLISHLFREHEPDVL